MPERKNELELTGLPADLLDDIAGRLPASDLANLRLGSHHMKRAVQRQWTLAIREHVDGMLANNLGPWLTGETGFFGNMRERTQRLLHTQRRPGNVSELRHMLNQGEPGRPPRQIRMPRMPGGHGGFPPMPHRGLQRSVRTQHFLVRRSGWILGGNHVAWPLDADLRRPLHPFRVGARALFQGAAGDDMYYAVHLILLHIHESFRDKPRQYLTAAFPRFLEALRREVNVEATRQTQLADSELQKLAQLLGFDLHALSTICQQIFDWQVLDRSRRLWGHQGERLAANSPVVADGREDPEAE